MLLREWVRSRRVSPDWILAPTVALRKRLLPGPGVVAGKKWGYFTARNNPFPDLLPGATMAPPDGTRKHAPKAVLPLAVVLAAFLLPSCRGRDDAAFVTDPASYVDPLIGTANGGNTFPGAVVPFGMVQWSPETTRGDPTRRPAPGGYQYDATRIRGFSLTHLSGTGCRGASGDVPFLPFTGWIESSPSGDTQDRRFAGSFAHPNETAEAGYYQVRFRDGVNTELTATARTGSARFTFPAGEPAFVLVRTSDSEVGSGDAWVEVDEESRTVRGWVSSGNFCGYIHPVIRHDYYTLYFVAEFDRPFTSVGSWENGDLRPGTGVARGGTGYGDAGYPVPGMGSGAYVGFDTGEDPVVGLRVGISYVSLDNARLNLESENPRGTSFDALRRGARGEWTEALSAIRVAGGTEAQRRIFYTALYHSLLHMNLFSDVNGEYWGFDGEAHAVSPPQEAQYANFSGWDVYRSQLQLVALLRPKVASDMAQSLFNQAEQNGGVWDRWTHNTGATHVMEGDASALAVAGIHAFGGRDFDVAGAFSSLARAARFPTPLDLSDDGCPVMCPGQRPSLDEWLELGYLSTEANAWGGAGETLEDVSADFALAQLALRLGDTASHREFLGRSGNWRNLFNQNATPHGGYIQDRNPDGAWAEFDPASSRGFAEGSSAQYTWMIPFDARGLMDAMGGPEAAVARLDDFFHHEDGSWALTEAGGLKAEMDNEPSIGAPWLYHFAGQPAKTQEIIREVQKRLWSDRPHGIPGNDDLGAMSSWYVWSALGMYPGYPGRSELLLAGPLFPRMQVQRQHGPTLTIRAEEASADTPFVHGLLVDGEKSSRPWLPEGFLERDAVLDFVLSSDPHPSWGTAPEDAPPSFPPGRAPG
jgi:predicted alpha-1,2-mannosidase